MEMKPKYVNIFCIIVLCMLFLLISIYILKKYHHKQSTAKNNVDTFSQQQLNDAQKELNNQKKLYSYMINRLPIDQTEKNSRLAPSVYTIDKLNEYANSLGTELNYQCRENKNVTDDTPCHMLCKKSNCRTRYADIKNTPDGYKWELPYKESPVLVDGLPKTLKDYCNTQTLNMNHFKRYEPRDEKDKEQSVVDSLENKQKMLNVYKDIGDNLQISGNTIHNKNLSKPLHLEIMKQLPDGTTIWSKYTLEPLQTKLIKSNAPIKVRFDMKQLL